ncbi:MAG TPA: methyltransferase domain-containing protein [Thermodesulfobacteriota bacterium]
MFAIPQDVLTPEDCIFYHTIDIPNHGLIEGSWDLRANVDDYLGRVDFKSKRVLEVGTANGYLCFEMERRGADVMGYDLSPAHNWDYVPYNGEVDKKGIEDRKKHIGMLNRAWWFGHKKFNSKAKVVYGSVYDIPQTIGPVHISTFGCILLHLRDPFLALQKAAILTTETIIVTEIMPVWLRKPSAYGRFFLKPFLNLLNPSIIFLPNPETKMPNDTWWYLPPEITCRFLNMLGFPKQTVIMHTQTYDNAPISLYTVVATKK